MATARFNTDDLKRLGLKADLTKGIVGAIGMEIERLAGKELTVDITPNRPDMLDIVGFARALSMFAGEQVPKEGHYGPEGEPTIDVAVSAKLKDIRPYIAAMVVRNLDLKEGNLGYLIEFAEKLADTSGRRRRKLAIGLHDFEKIKPPISYEAAKEGEIVPLGETKVQSFDKVVSGTNQGKEYGGIVGKGPYPFVADSEKTMSLAPIINSELTRIGKGTTEIFVEITGTSLHAVNDALCLLACRFIDAGGRVQPCTIVYGKKAEMTPELVYREMKVKDISIDKALGAIVEPNKIITMANRMGYVAAKYGNGKDTMFYVPPYRLDVLNEQDIIDDMAIAYGYERITPIPIMGSSVGIEDDVRAGENRMARFMIGLGFSEAVNYYLTNERANFESMMMKKEVAAIKVAQSKTEEITMLRTSLLPGLLRNLSSSGNDTMPQMLFEIGPIFNLDGKKVKERRLLSIVSEHPKANFAEIKSVVEVMLPAMGVGVYSLENSEESGFIPGRCAVILVKGKPIGHFGEIHPQVLNIFKIEEPVVAAEISLLSVHEMLG
ncbi:MAG TPA: phenylalanine--tRNA ligase subunit beta [Candidatus Baltobacteraceae bacterium]|nr:phenylalanine--tRNA ligase subunit beta [Candidatus Baltobacteraceae bacterium]